MRRPFVDKMGEFLGHLVVLKFKPGAGGGVGAGQVATSKADGYTLVGSLPGSIVVVPLANKDIVYAPASYTPVAALPKGGFMLVVALALPWKNMKDVVEYSKRNPGKVAYSSSGFMGITHLLGEIFTKEAAMAWHGIKAHQTPDRGRRLHARMCGHQSRLWRWRRLRHPSSGPGGDVSGLPQSGQNPRRARVHLQGIHDMGLKPRHPAHPDRARPPDPERLHQEFQRCVPRRVSR